MLDPKPHWSQWKWNSWLGSQVGLRSEPRRYLHSVTWLKPQISKFFLTKWQQRWNNNINNKLFQIKPTLGEWRSAFRKSRKEQVIISLLRIGHTSLTDSLILKQGQPWQCLTCQTPYTIKHVLVECGAVAITRESSILKQIMWERYVWEYPHAQCSLFLERYRVIPRNITLFIIQQNLAIQLSNRLSIDKLLLNSNTWNH